MVAGLLTVALLLFVFAQAAVTRSSAQSAADAAALAAAQEARDRLFDRFGEGLADEDADLGAILEGDDFATGSACDAAARLAAANDATIEDCRVADGGVPGYSVRVGTRGTVGDSLLPGTENEHAYATATAVIATRCEVTEEDEDDQEEDQGGAADGADGGQEGAEGGATEGAGGEEAAGGAAEGEEDGGEGEEEGRGPVRLDCDGDDDWTIDPGQDDDAAFPDARDLFRVYLRD
jgi:hypothetical protein